MTSSKMRTLLLPLLLLLLTTQVSIVHAQIVVGDIVSSCPTGTSGTLNQSCTGGLVIYYCSGHATFRNDGCALCNGINVDAIAIGSCNESYNPCSATQCSSNQHCARTALDCGFDFNTSCYWSLEGAARVVQQGNNGAPQVDDTFGNDRQSRAGVVMLPQGSSVVSPLVNVMPTGTANSCMFSFAVYGVGDGRTRDLQLMVEQTIVWSLNQQAASGTNETGGWTRFEASIASSMVNNSRISLSSENTPTTVFVDTVQLRCEETTQDGICSCNDGWHNTPIESVPCSPTLMAKIKDTPELSRFYDVISSAGVTFENQLSDPGRFYTVFAPTNDAFGTVNGGLLDQLLQNSTRAAELIGYHISPASSPALSFTGTALLDRVASRSGRTIPSISGQNITFSIEAGNFSIGGAAIVGEYGCINGIILAVSSVTFPENHPPPSTTSCGVEDCGKDNGLSTCRGVPDPLGGTSWAPYSQTSCNCGGSFDPTGYVCGTDGRSYRSRCHLNNCAENVTVRYDQSACIVPSCVCNSNSWRPTDNSPCIMGSPPTTARATLPPDFSVATPEPIILSRIEFYLNGSFFQFVQSRRMMMDQVFTESVRQAFGSPNVGLTNIESALLLIDTHPSSRMPGYILVEVGSPSLSVLNKIQDAIVAGRVQISWVRPGDSVPIVLLAYPMIRESLPPIVRYTFWVDVTYEDAICRTDPREGVCVDEYINQEDFAGGLRWYLQRTVNLPNVANDSRVYMWPTNSTRPGIVGKVEMLATAMQSNAHLLLSLRELLENGQALVMVMDAINSGDEDRHYVAKTLPVDKPHEGDLQLRTTIGRYPGSALSPPIGEVDVREGPSKGSLEIRWSLTMTDPRRSGGIHIHVGTTCEDASLVGGHFYLTTNDDAWNDVRWSTDIGGNTIGYAVLHTGYEIAENLGHAVVIHNSTGGRIGCGLLTQSQADTPNPLNLTKYNPVPISNTNAKVDAVENTGISVSALVAVVVLMLVLLAALGAYYRLHLRNASTFQTSSPSEAYDNLAFQPHREHQTHNDSTGLGLSNVEDIPNGDDQNSEVTGYMEVTGIGEKSSASNTNPFT